ncbi:MAG: VOC family protein [Defluviitaleaceae bacterium]|nr:VOC family protein [Defluviitaleaceae bacterium]
MIVPALHFCGDCKEAIALYEKAFTTKATIIVSNSQFSPDEHDGDDGIAHSEMIIHGQRVLLNDRFGNKDKSPDVPIRLIVMFDSVEKLLSCYEYFKDECIVVDPFEDVGYSKLFGNFIDKFGIGWGFMVETA